MALRVRFAPSPTGYLHIGNARAALINWLLAKKHGGTFILRLDDTDKERSTDAYAQAIFDDMAWMGLTYDECFKQSDRLNRYHEVFESLKKEGHLYPCYETPEELDFKRKRQLAKGQSPLYDRAALALSDLDKQNLEKKGLKPHWRFKLKDEAITWHDGIRGPVHFPKSTLSDPVLIRADGMVLYTFASVVDDVDSNITHIVRGEDHVSNTAVQIQLFNALGKNPLDITFAHTTLLMDAKGSPLSKRLGSLSLRGLRESGIEPMSIASLLAHLGTSHNIDAYDDLPELASLFDLEIFSRTAPRFDEGELFHMNQKLYHQWNFIRVKEKVPTGVDDALWMALRENITTLSDLAPWVAICYGDITRHETNATLEKDYLAQALDLLPPEPWDNATWDVWVKQLKECTHRKGRALFMPLRLALTGMDHGPEMKAVFPLIGRQKVCERLVG